METKVDGSKKVATLASLILGLLLLRHFWICYRNTAVKHILTFLPDALIVIGISSVLYV